MAAATTPTLTGAAGAAATRDSGGGGWGAFGRFGAPLRGGGGGGGDDGQDDGDDAGLQALLQRAAPRQGAYASSPRYSDATRRALQLDDALPRGELPGSGLGGSSGMALEEPGAVAAGGASKSGSSMARLLGRAPSSSSSSTAAAAASRGPAGAAAGTARWVILPDSQFRSIWMQLQLAVAMYIIWVTPVRVGFDIPSEGLWFWFEGVIDAFFYADLALNFFTAYEDPVTGDPVTDLRAIARRYLGGWFAVDALATFPADYLVRAVEGTWGCSLRADCLWSAAVAAAGSHVGLIGALRLLRFFRVAWILKHVRFMRFSVVLGGLADELYAFMPALSIAELLIILMYLGHVSGCFFYLLSTPDWQTPHERSLIASGKMVTWMQRAFGGHRVVTLPSAGPFANATAAAAAAGGGPVVRDPVVGGWWGCPSFGFDATPCATCDAPHVRCRSHYSLPFRYVTSMYWAYTTMTTVGYGDISSSTAAEKLWAITVMIVAGFFFSFVVGRMASIVAKLDSSRAAYNERLEVVTTFLKDTALPRELSRRVIDVFKAQRIRPYDRQAVLGMLPFELKAKILRHLYSGAISSVPLLRALAGDDDVFLTDVCVRLQPYSAAAKTFVYQRGEAGGDLFILLRGELHQLDVDGAALLRRLPEGSVFGEGSVLRHLQGFSRAKRTENMWAKAPCALLRVAQEDVIDLLRSHPQLLAALTELAAENAAAAAAGGASGGAAAAAAAGGGGSVTGGAGGVLRSASARAQSKTTAAVGFGGLLAPSSQQQQQQQQSPAAGSGGSDLIAAVRALPPPSSSPSPSPPLTAASSMVDLRAGLHLTAAGGGDAAAAAAAATAGAAAVGPIKEPPLLPRAAGDDAGGGGGPAADLPSAEGGGGSDDAAAKQALAAVAALRGEVEGLARLVREQHATLLAELRRRER